MTHRTNASGKAYVLAWKTAEGRQIQKFADPDAAIEEGRLKAGQIADGLVAGAEVSRADRDELFAARAIVGDVPILSALREWQRVRDLTQGHAIAAAEAWAQRNRNTFSRILASDAVDKFIAAKERAKKQGERTYRSKLDPIKLSFPERYLDSISSDEWTAYLEQWQDGVTRNDFRKRAVTLCRWAQKSGYIPRGIQLEVEQTERAHEEATEIGTITPSTYSSALEFIREKHPEHLAALVLAGFGAVRSDEIHGKRHDRIKRKKGSAPVTDECRRQTWEDVDLERKFLNVTVAKKNTPSWRLVELCDAAIDWLMLCPNRKGPVCVPGAMEKIRLLLKEAGFFLPENCFRHSAISYRIAVTGDKAATATWAGNSVKEIDRRYRRPMTKAAGETWFAIRPKTGADVVDFGQRVETKSANE